MVLVALIAGVLIETTGLLQGRSEATGRASSDRVTERVGIESATASDSGVSTSCSRRLPDRAVSTSRGR
jgi:archaellin